MKICFFPINNFNFIFYKNFSLKNKYYNFKNIVKCTHSFVLRKIKVT